jgi:hypothetical protein
MTLEDKWTNQIIAKNIYTVSMLKIGFCNTIGIQFPVKWEYISEQKFGLPSFLTRSQQIECFTKEKCMDIAGDRNETTTNHQVRDSERAVLGTDILFIRVSFSTLFPLTNMTRRRLSHTDANGDISSGICFLLRPHLGIPDAQLN